MTLILTFSFSRVNSCESHQYHLYTSIFKSTIIPLKLILHNYYVISKRKLSLIGDNYSLSNNLLNTQSEFAIYS